MQVMTIRNPKFDFSQTSAHWAPCVEFALTFNATSVLFPPLERFLNRVMSMAREQITGSDPRSLQLREDIALFRRQEGVHYAVHTSFNDMLARSGYVGLAELESEIERDYQEMLATKSLDFLVGYCEGFEIQGPVFAHIWLDEMSDLFEGADPTAVAMWKWHICEEFEHRTVCFDMQQWLQTSEEDRRARIEFSQQHQAAFVQRVLGHLLLQYWEPLSSDEIQASRERLVEVGGRMKGSAEARLRAVYSPSYTPRDAPIPDSYAITLAAIERDYVHSRA
jgi:predicted metal-dependent hydrolase